MEADETSSDGLFDKLQKNHNVSVCVSIAARRAPENVGKTWSRDRIYYLHVNVVYFLFY